MRKRKSNLKKSFSKKKNKKFWNKPIYQWMNRHSCLASLLSLLVYLFLGGLVGFILIKFDILPKQFQELSLSFPLYFNFIVPLVLLYVLLTEKLSESFWSMVKFRILMLFQLNLFGLILHSIVGLPSKRRGHGAPPLWQLRDKPIWFPIATYLFFIALYGVLYLIIKFWQKKKFENNK